MGKAVNPRDGYSRPFKLPTKLKSLVPNPPYKDKEWVAKAKVQYWWYSKNTIDYMVGKVPTTHMEYYSDLYKFRDFILKKAGGYEVDLSKGEGDTKDILERGVVLYGENAKFVKGEPNQCHLNSINYWKKKKDTKDIVFMTGYALSEDGIWRQHSWLLSQGIASSKVIETTTPRIAYFGYILTEEEAQAFYNDYN